MRSISHFDSISSCVKACSLACAIASCSCKRNFSGSFSSFCFLSNSAAFAFTSATWAIALAVPDLLECPKLDDLRTLLMTCGRLIRRRLIIFNLKDS